MKPSEVAATLELLIKSNKPAHITGAPGVGKTSVVYQTTKKLKMDTLVTRLSDREPVDLVGLPVTDLKKGTTRWLTPDEFPREGCKPTVWFFDEWSQGLPTVQNVAGRLLNERALGVDYKLPSNVYICAASNRAKDRAATNRVPAHIADRFWWLSMEVDTMDWCRWAFDAGLETEVIAFIRWREGDPRLKGVLSAFDPNVDVSPTPRSWEDVSIARKTMKKHKIVLPDVVEEQFYAGKVGTKMAAEFMGFVKVFRQLPDPTAMFMNPDKCELPTDPATLCALTAGLARKATDANMDRFVRIANRMQDEFSVLMMTLATGINAELASTRPYIQWAEKHQDVLF